MTSDEDKSDAGSGAPGNAEPVAQSAAAAANDGQPARIRRFYHQAGVVASDGGFVLELDGRTARTPGKHPLAVPTEQLAQAIASEWAAQGSDIVPADMPLTRIANTVIDGVIPNVTAVRSEIVKYAGSDLMCYRAEAPVELVQLQQAAWDPLVAWARDQLKAGFVTTDGLMPITQSDDALSAVRRMVDVIPPIAVGPVQIMTSMTGSAILALAVYAGRLTVGDAWSAAHIDEDWQISQWGEDHEATVRRERRWQEMAAAASFVALSRA
ncbi:MAG: ATP12 family protein [Pseudomonadota bacterium]